MKVTYFYNHRMASYSALKFSIDWFVICVQPKNSVAPIVSNRIGVLVGIYHYFPNKMLNIKKNQNTETF